MRAGAWNSLPSFVTSSSSLSTFKRHLKTYTCLRPRTDGAASLVSFFVYRTRRRFLWVLRVLVVFWTKCHVNLFVNNNNNNNDNDNDKRTSTNQVIFMTAFCLPSSVTIHLSAVPLSYSPISSKSTPMIGACANTCNMTSTSGESGHIWCPSIRRSALDQMLWDCTSFGCLRNSGLGGVVDSSAMGWKCSGSTEICRRRRGRDWSCPVLALKPASRSHRQRNLSVISINRHHYYYYYYHHHHHWQQQQQQQQQCQQQYIRPTATTHLRSCMAGARIFAVWGQRGAEPRASGAKGRHNLMSLATGGQGRGLGGAPLAPPMRSCKEYWQLKTHFQSRELKI